MTVPGTTVTTPFSTMLQVLIAVLPATSYSLGASAGGNLFNTDPLFVNANQPLGIDNIARTSDDGLTLSPCSPLINNGITINPPITTDILGNGRVGNYDIGAYEYQGPSLVIVGTITGDSIICLNSTVTLSNSVAGGTWTSSNTAVATVSATGQVTGIANGTAVISYRTGTTNCPGTVATRNVTVTTSSMPAPITGSDTVCTTRSIQLSNTVAGGVWITSNSAIVTVSNTGVVTGIASGTATISYRTGGTGCANTATKNIVVSPSPAVNAVTGDYWVCMYGIPRYTSTTPGGIWSTASNGVRSTISAAGVLTPASTGIDTVIYTVTNANGCFQSAKMQINIVGIPAAFNNLSGPGSVCAGKTIQLSNGLFGVSGGTWSTQSGGVKSTINTTGLVLPVTAGTIDTVRYIVTNSAGCADTAYKIINVGASPVVSNILGVDSICAHTATSLTNATPNGIWSSGNTSIATIDLNGMVTGLSQGIVTINYTVTNAVGCSASVSKNIYVKAAPAVNSITGATSICVNGTSQYNNSTPGGLWTTASNGSIGSINASGMLTAHATGTDTIRYSVVNSTGCASVAALVVTDAINAAAAGDEIWVKAGTYRPTLAMDGLWTATPAYRAFSLIYNDVKLYGGFAGTETLAAQRNASLYVTILSGDLDGNAGTNDAFHVLVTNQRTAACVIDGFTITGGRADSSGYFLFYPNGTAHQYASFDDYNGAGIYNYKSSPTISNCIIRNNSANNHGAGMYNNECRSYVYNCSFMYNISAIGMGGGISNYNEATSVTLSADRTRLEGDHYYRLKIRESNGQESYSRTVLVKSDGMDGAVVTVFPNPASDQVTVRCTETGLLGSRAVLVDMKGRVIKEFVLEKEVLLDIQQLAAGVYVLSLADGSAIRIVRM
ncbi:hypothetical protein OSTOST_10020 [Ostertagia ostertagi]